MCTMIFSSSLMRKIIIIIRFTFETVKTPNDAMRGRDILYVFRYIYSLEMTLPSMQRSLLGLTVLTIVGLMTFLLSKKLALETRKRDGLLLDVIANISDHLDRLDSGFDGIAAQTGIARNRLLRLVALHRENLLVCALLGEKWRQKQMLSIGKPMTMMAKRRKRRRRFIVSHYHR